MKQNQDNIDGEENFPLRFLPVLGCSLVAGLSLATPPSALLFAPVSWHLAPTAALLSCCRRRRACPVALTASASGSCPSPVGGWWSVSVYHSLGGASPPSRYASPERGCASPRPCRVLGAHASCVWVCLISGSSLGSSGCSLINPTSRRTTAIGAMAMRFFPLSSTRVPGLPCFLSFYASSTFRRPVCSALSRAWVVVQGPL